MNASQTFINLKTSVPGKLMPSDQSGAVVSGTISPPVPIPTGQPGVYVSKVTPDIPTPGKFNIC